MFSGSSNNKSKRRSFFLFGSEPKNDTFPNKTKEKHLKSSNVSSSNKPSSHKNHSSSLPQPLSKSQLKNTDRVLGNTPPSDEDTPSKNTNISTTITSNSPITESHTVQRNKIRRPPPPVFDMEKISKSLLQKANTSNVAKSGFLDNASDNNNIDISSDIKDNDLIYSTPSNMSKELSPHPYVTENGSVDIYEKRKPFNTKLKSDEASSEAKYIVSNTDRKQHRKQRSDAEELVNDIDIYIKEYQEDSNIIDNFQSDKDIHNQDINHDYKNSYSNYDRNLQNTLDIEPIATTFDHLNTSEYSNLDTPILNVSPLNIVNDSNVTPTSLKNPLTTKNASTNDPPSFDNTDNSSSDFSFSNSLSGRKDIANEFSDQENTNINSILRKSSYDPFFNVTNSSTSTIHISQNHISSDIESDNGISNSLSCIGIDSSDNRTNIQHPPKEAYDSASSNSIILQSEKPCGKLRVANEDHPTFFIKDDISLTDTDTNTMQSTDMESINDEHYTNVVPRNDMINNTNEHSGRTMLLDLHDTSSTEMNPFKSNSGDVANPTSTYEPNNKSELSTINSGAKSVNGMQSISGHSSRSTERTSKLVSSYVEELRLKYFQTSNFLEAPPNLPLALKQKNNLIQPKNIKVKIRTNTKQVGIKHGKVKQKLLSLETTIDDNKNIGSNRERTSTFVDHTKEFHKFFNKENEQSDNYSNKDQLLDSSSDYLNDIPGDEAYNSDDILAPLREKKDSENSISRSGTVVSYYTRSKNRILKETEDMPDLPSNIYINTNQSGVSSSGTSMYKNGRTRSGSISSVNTQVLTNKISGSMGLHVTNPDSESDG